MSIPTYFTHLSTMPASDHVALSHIALDSERNLHFSQFSDKYPLPSIGASYMSLMLQLRLDGLRHELQHTTKWRSSAKGEETGIATSISLRKRTCGIHK